MLCIILQWVGSGVMCVCCHPLHGSTNSGCMNVTNTGQNMCHEVSFVMFFYSRPTLRGFRPSKNFVHGSTGLNIIRL